jgi:hypothetical protein
MSLLFDFARPKVLALLKVPHDPHPPSGSPGSLRVFRAGRTYYRLKLFLWGLRQVGVLAAFLFGVLFLHAWVLHPPEFIQHWGPFRFLARNPEFVPRWHIDVWLLIVEIGGFIIALAQIPFTYAMVRMDYEYRWYLVTDRSLRIRAGLTNIRETTFSFANIQQIVVKQGPLQRLLGLADVVVTTAGGGGHQQPQPGQSLQTEPLHQGVFHAVENAEEIRDLITERLRVLKSAGLGDPDDPDSSHPATPRADDSGKFPHPVVSHAAALDAGRELLVEARRLRQVLR